MCILCCIRLHRPLHQKSIINFIRLNSHVRTNCMLIGEQIVGFAEANIESIGAETNANDFN